MTATAALEVMLRFAERTCIGSGAAGRRYLWTDAFAVCNFLGLARAGHGDDCLRLALTLIDDVHHVLGRHRLDDTRSGWISGLDKHAGEARPTRGGLRIGKPAPERPPGTPHDPAAEWDRDGQYFHYLTRWMHALDQTAWATGEPRFNRWALDLAVAAFRGFTYEPQPGAVRRMYWKMSIDLSRPQVSAMGQHDPLDGYLTLLQVLQWQPQDRAAAPFEPDVTQALEAFAAMSARGRWTTDDPLGLGGLLVDVHRTARLAAAGAALDPRLLPALLRDARRGLDALLAQQPWRLPAARRLAFRELGLAIGLQAVRSLHQFDTSSGAVAALAAHGALADELVAFWALPGSQRADTWTDHRDINEVMLATALMPEGYLERTRR